MVFCKPQLKETFLQFCLLLKKNMRFQFFICCKSYNKHKTPVFFEIRHKKYKSISV